MRYSRLGRTSLRVSQICIGTFMYGGRTSISDSERMIAQAADAGVNFIDTADQYGKGTSEEIVGTAIAARRGDWILATKLGNPMTDGPNSRGLSRHWIMRAAEESLRRLRTEWIDVLYMHNEDRETPVEETLLALRDLIRAGKVRYFGVSNHSGWKVAEIATLCRQLEMDPPILSQPHYNITDRTAEAEHIPACERFGIAVAPSSPLARGILTGKYTPGEKPAEGTRAGISDRRLLELEWRPEAIEAAWKVRRHAEAKGMTATQFAILWLLDNKQVCAAVVGARTPDQLDGYLSAMDHTLDGQDEAFVDALVAPGHMAAPWFTDPQYPVRGRFPRSPASSSG